MKTILFQYDDLFNFADVLKLFCYPFDSITHTNKCE